MAVAVSVPEVIVVAVVGVRVAVVVRVVAILAQGGSGAPCWCELLLALVHKGSFAHDDDYDDYTTTVRAIPKDEPIPDRVP